MPRASEKLLLHIKQTLSGDDNLKARFEALLSEVEQYDTREREMSLDVQLPQSTKPLAKWRQRVRIAISSIVDSRHYSWTEINDVSDKQYALYNLRQINDYFKGFVFISPMRLRNSLSTRGSFEASQAPRDAVVEKLSNLICVLTRCEDVQCTGETRYVDVFALSDIIESMLRAGQVTTANRRMAYNTLRHGIRHHSDGTSFHEWSRTSEVVFKGVVDKDRSIRLAAG